jgi:hypothetical protein
LIKMLIETGVIATTGESWQVDLKRLTDAQVPPTLTGVLQARLDRLASEERTALQQASVVGRRFWDEAVEHIQVDSGVTNQPLERHLVELQRRELVFPQETSTFREAREFLFKHALLRDVAYESVLRRLRREYHGLVADWLINRRRGRSGEVDGLIGDHLERAGRPYEAAGYLARAAREAAGRYANQEAIAYYRRAIALLEPHADQPTDQTRLAGWQEALGDVLGLLRQAEPARAAYQRARGSLPPHDRPGRARLHRKQGDYFDQFDLRRRAYDRAAAILGEPGEGADEAWWAAWIDLQISRIWMNYSHDRPEEIDRLEGQILPIIQEKGTTDQQLAISQALLARDNRRDRFVIPAERVARVRELVKQIQVLGNRREIASQQFGLGFYLLWHGDLEGAAAELDGASRGARAVGDGWTQTAALIYLSICRRLQGDVEAVRELASDCLTMAETIGLQWYVGAAQGQQAWLAWRGGDRVRAESLAVSALEGMTRDEYPFRWIALLPLASCYLEDGNLGEAIAAARQLDEPLQRPLPPVAHSVLRSALEAWDAGHGEDARVHLKAMLARAKDDHYL